MWHIQVPSRREPWHSHIPIPVSAGTPEASKDQRQLLAMVESELQRDPHRQVLSPKVLEGSV